MSAPASRLPAGAFTPWPDEAVRRYVAEGYWGEQALGELLREWAARSPGATAVVADDRRLSYAELDREADAVAMGFAARGIAPGDRVLVQLPNCAEFVTVLFGLLRCAAVPVLVLPAHRRSEVEHLARLSEAVGCVVPDRFQGFDHRPLAEQVRAAVPGLDLVVVVGDPGGATPYTDLVGATAATDPLPVPDAAEVALLLVSGGTTGAPKLIPRTHRDYAYNALAAARVCDFTAADAFLVCLPAGHNFPLCCPGILGTLAVGGTVVLTRTPTPDAVFGLLEREPVTVTALVPPLVRLWADAAGDWSGRARSALRLLLVGGARLDPSLADRVGTDLGCALIQGIGMAEGLLAYTRPDDPPELVRATQGRPISPADEVRVVGPDGTDVAPGATGELWTRGPYTLRGYYRAPEHNALAFTPDGFYRTGDLVRVLPSGHLVVEGRIKDVINRGGENVSAAELEEHLLDHPDVVDVAVVGLPDDVLGEVVCAVLVLAEGAPEPRPKDVTRFLGRRGLARFKLPDRVVCRRALPLTAVGKPDKRALVDRYGRGAVRR
ncbi:(2,3-dihydroxybenzoyl)adenylate synthase [Pseudonocardia lacus]|uniref:(2,3-dihydroxybenzoyl)adenylate synthase n=1 Tax=Pseudonocardia lacus TaxID=2835865 RepID=UPI0027E2D365|nr:AMP-binding protein [Pseudonocardia lacus]